MNIMYVLLSASLFVALIFLGAFIWAYKSDQFKDCYTPAMRILLDENENQNK